MTIILNAVTPERAKRRWCPFTRIGENRWLEPGEEDMKNTRATCIADECMAWRFVPGTDDNGWGKGYCGLAGRP
jgi:hypothetical protein